MPKVTMPKDHPSAALIVDGQRVKAEEQMNAECRPLLVQLTRSAEKFIDRDDVKQVVVVVAPEDRAAFVEKFAANLAFMGITLAEGGAHRAESVRRGLEKLRPEIDTAPEKATKLAKQLVKCSKLLELVREMGPVVATMSKTELEVSLDGPARRIFLPVIVMTDTAGNHCAFVLLVSHDGVTQYVSNASRADGVELIESLLARWKQGRADIPAHYNPDLKKD